MHYLILSIILTFFMKSFALADDVDSLVYAQEKSLSAKAVLKDVGNLKNKFWLDESHFSGASDRDRMTKEYHFIAKLLAIDENDHALNLIKNALNQNSFSSVPQKMVYYKMQFEALRQKHDYVSASSLCIEKLNDFYSEENQSDLETWALSCSEVAYRASKNNSFVFQGIPKSDLFKAIYSNWNIRIEKSKTKRYVFFAAALSYLGQSNQAIELLRNRLVSEQSDESLSSAYYVLSLLYKKNGQIKNYEDILRCLNGSMFDKSVVLRKFKTTDLIVDLVQKRLLALHSDLKLKGYGLSRQLRFIDQDVDYLKNLKIRIKEADTKSLIKIGNILTKIETIYPTNSQFSADVNNYSAALDGLLSVGRLQRLNTIEFLQSFLDPDAKMFLSESLQLEDQFNEFKKFQDLFSQIDNKSLAIVSNDQSKFKTFLELRQSVLRKSSIVLNDVVYRELNIHKRNEELLSYREAFENVVKCLKQNRVTFIQLQSIKILKTLRGQKNFSKENKIQEELQKQNSEILEELRKLAIFSLESNVDFFMNQNLWQYKQIQLLSEIFTPLIEGYKSTLNRNRIQENSQAEILIKSWESLDSTLKGIYLGANKIVADIDAKKKSILNTIQEIVDSETVIDKNYLGLSEMVAEEYRINLPSYVQKLITKALEKKQSILLSNAQKNTQEIESKRESLDSFYEENKVRTQFLDSLLQGIESGILY